MTETKEKIVRLEKERLSMNAYKKVQNHHNLHINFNRISLRSTPVLAPQKSIYKKEKKKKDTPGVNLATQP